MRGIDAVFLHRSNHLVLILLGNRIDLFKSRFQFL